VSATTLTCASCAAAFPAPTPRRGARPQRFCTPKCQIKSANERRSIKRRGNLSTTGKAPGRPVAPGVTIVPPTAQTPLSDHARARLSAQERLEELMQKAHSRTGINAWEIAELAKLRNISPWAPARVIIARKVSK
jgi:hypothetical protein